MEGDVPATRIFFASTSYPRSEADWQGIFIRHICDHMGRDEELAIKLWAPTGPTQSNITPVVSTSDQNFLSNMAAHGGLAHLLRSKPLTGLWYTCGLLWRLRRAMTAEQNSIDVYHTNWLQLALALLGKNKPVLIPVLGTDFRLLSLPGMPQLIRLAIGKKRCVICPNAQWMAPRLSDLFGDRAEIKPVPFGVDEVWYKVERQQQSNKRKWLAVFRLTADKVGPLFDWGEKHFQNSDDELHLFGPNVEQLDIPSWVYYHGPVPPETLAQQWFPHAAGLITLSQHSEGLPQVVIEAMAASLPIIASGIPAHRTALGVRQSGFITDTEQDFAAALDYLSNTGNNTAVGNNAREQISSEYGTWNDCINRYKTLYRKLLD